MQAVWNKFLSSSEIEDIIQWMRSHGVNVREEMKYFSALPDSVIVTPSRLRIKRNALNYSVKAFENEVKEQILIHKLNDLIDELIASGNDFAHLYLILHVSRPAIEKLFQDSEFFQASENLGNLGVDVDYLKFLVYDILRWN